MQPDSTQNGHTAPATDHGSPEARQAPKYLYLIRHGQSTYNVEGRLPGQLSGVALTDIGRQQAYQAAVALSSIPLSAVLSSPLERAAETALAIAKGAALTVRYDARLLDTNVGAWAGRKISDLVREDPAWKAFVKDPTAPPPGVEGWLAVRERTVAAIADILGDESAGHHIVVVAHADVIKLILGHYLRMHMDSIKLMHVGNATISALEFDPGLEWPRTIAINWSPVPGWLAPRVSPKAAPVVEQPTLITEATITDQQPSLFADENARSTSEK